jgi:hypothetical protein
VGVGIAVANLVSNQKDRGLEWKKRGEVWGLGGEKRVHEMLHADCGHWHCSCHPCTYRDGWRRMEGAVTGVPVL